jgi:hypothetical protein
MGRIRARSLGIHPVPHQLLHVQAGARGTVEVGYRQEMDGVRWTGVMATCSAELRGSEAAMQMACCSFSTAVWIGMLWTERAKEASQDVEGVGGSTVG